MTNYNSNILTNLEKARQRFEKMQEEKLAVYSFMVGIADALGYKVEKIQDEYNRGPYGIVFDEPELPIKLLMVGVNSKNSYYWIENHEFQKGDWSVDYYKEGGWYWAKTYDYPTSNEGLTEEYKQECIVAIKKFIEEAKRTWIKEVE